jgi:hypothetical protein
MGKFIAAKFEHDTARPVDGYVAPQLHTHAVIFNLTEREDSQARAIQPQSLFASQQFASAVYQSELTYRLKELGYEIIVGRSGAPEIKGYTQEYLDVSRPRSQRSSRAAMLTAPRRNAQSPFRPAGLHHRAWWWDKIFAGTEDFVEINSMFAIQKPFNLREILPSPLFTCEGLRLTIVVRFD